jgi:hypothetical protein
VTIEDSILTNNKLVQVVSDLDPLNKLSRVWSSILTYEKNQLGDENSLSMPHNFFEEY